MRRLRVAAAALALAGAVGVGVWQAATAPDPQSLESRRQAVAATLRCPTCQNLSAADSPGDMAVAMREIIADQLADGRSPDQVRDFFVERYGPWVLLYPQRDGIGWLAYGLPVLAVAGLGGFAAVRLHRRQRGSSVELSEADRERVDNAYRSFLAGDLPTEESHESERLESALTLLRTVRGENSTAHGAAEQVALRQVAACLNHDHHGGAIQQRERPRTAAAPLSRAAVGARRRVPRPLLWTLVCGGFTAVLAAVLVGGISPRGVGDPTTGDGGAPDRTSSGATEPAGMDLAALLDEADARAQQGDLDAANAGYRLVLDARPDDRVTRLKLAFGLFQLGAVDETRDHVETILDTDPEDPDGLLLLGLVQLGDGDPEGRRTLERFLTLAPDDHPGRAVARTQLAEER